MKIKYFICAVAVLTGSLQAIGQTYSGSFHCKPSPGSVAKGDVDVTAELTVKNGVAQMRRSSVKYEELLEGRVRGTSLNLEGQGHFYDRPNPWTTRLRGSLQGNTFRAQGEIINSKGETTRICEVNLQIVEAPAVSSPAVSASFDCQKASSPAEQAICNSPQLAALDISLAEAYKIAFAQATDKVAFKQGQNDWRKNVRDLCSTDECIRDAYQSRLKNIGQPRLEVVQPVATSEVPQKVLTQAPSALPRPVESQSEAITIEQSPKVNQQVNESVKPTEVTMNASPKVDEDLKKHPKYEQPSNSVQEIAPSIKGKSSGLVTMYWVVLALALLANAGYAAYKHRHGTLTIYQDLTDATFTGLAPVITILTYLFLRIIDVKHGGAFVAALCVFGGLMWYVVKSTYRNNEFPFGFAMALIAKLTVVFAYYVYLVMLWGNGQRRREGESNNALNARMDRDFKKTMLKTGAATVALMAWSKWISRSDEFISVMEYCYPTKSTKANRVEVLEISEV